MVWNYRVVRKENKGPFVTEDERYAYGIHEVYYNDAGEIESCTVEPVDPYGTTEGELFDCMAKMNDALKKPVLDYDTDIPGGPSPEKSALDEVLDPNDAQSGC